MSKWYVSISKRFQIIPEGQVINENNSNIIYLLK